jgi:sugar O-acyltransferase (sialic acid O-acetyltransferase NeuD family)
VKTLSILGAGGHGGVVADAALQMRRWDRIEFHDDRLAAGSEAYGFKLKGTSSELLNRSFAADVAPDVVVAIGANARRLELTRQLLQAGAALATVVHPAAIVGSRVTIGAGSVLMAGAVVNIATKIGLACIINTGANVDHDCDIGDGVHVCPGAALAGNVRIADLAWVGIGSSVIQGRNVGTRAVVGAGSVVIRDVENDVTVAGNPARELRRG